MFFLDVTDPTMAWGSPFIVMAVGVAAVVLTVAVPVLTAVLVRYINKKHDYQVSEADQSLFNNAVATIVTVVEQDARRALKLGDDAPEGAKKLEEAIEKGEEALKALGIYDKFKDVLQDAIEKKVGEMNGPLTAKEKDEIRATLPPKEDD